MRVWQIITLTIAIIIGLTPAHAQGSVVDRTYDNALMCALLYAHFGDEGPAFDQLVTIAAELGAKTPEAIRADIAGRRPILSAAYADGRLDENEAYPLTQNACPNTFVVAQANSVKVKTTTINAPDAAQCAGLFRFFDQKFPSNTWGTTWAGDEMARRGAQAVGISQNAFETQADRAQSNVEARYRNADNAGVVAMLDQATACQTAYDTPVPPGVVLAAVQFGDRPGIARGRNHYCTALSNDFFRNYPNLDTIEQSIWQHPIRAMDEVEQTLKSLQWPAEQMQKAQCPDQYAAPVADALDALMQRVTSTADAALQKAQHDGPWW